MRIRLSATYWSKPLLAPILLLAIAVPFLFRDRSPSGANRPARSSQDQLPLRRTVTLPVPSPYSGHDNDVTSPSNSLPSPTIPSKGRSDDLLGLPTLPRQYRPLDHYEPIPAPIADEFGAQMDRRPTRSDTSDARVPSQTSEASSRSTASPQMRLHTISDGDTLPDLADRYLGDRQRYLELFELNRNVLPHPDILPLGTTIQVPPWGSKFQVGSSKFEESGTGKGRGT